VKSILDPSFRYTPSAETDVSKTFARVRRELRARQHPVAGSERGCSTVCPEHQNEPPEIALLEGLAIRETAPQIVLVTLIALTDLDRFAQLGVHARRHLRRDEEMEIR